MRREDREAALLLAPKRVLVRKQTFQLRLGERLVRRRRVLPHDRDAIVPAAVFRAVEPRRLRSDPLDVPQLDLPLQYGEVVLLEEPDELVGKKSTRLNSSHVRISYAVFCLKKKKIEPNPNE